MTLEVPLHIAPTFVSSGQCEITWCIQFEFVVTNDRIFHKVPQAKSIHSFIRHITFKLNHMQNEEDLRAMTAVSEDGEEIAQEWNGPRQVGVQTLLWNLPIKVLPCDPCHVELSVKNRSQFRFALQKPRTDIAGNIRQNIATGSGRTVTTA